MAPPRPPSIFAEFRRCAAQPRTRPHGGGFRPEADPSHQSFPAVMTMKKLINSADTLIAESLEGFASAHADIVVLASDRSFVRRRHLRPGKVALISGGGSGHEPLHAGFVGLGMLDAACPGQIFTSPTTDQMIAWG